MHTKSQNETSQFQPASATQSTDTDSGPKGVALAPPPFQFKGNDAAEYETEQDIGASQSFLSTTGDAGNNGASAVQLKEANPNERWGVDQFFEGYQAEVDRSSLTEEEQAYFDNYAQRAQVYLSRPNMKWTDGVLTGQMFADAALQTYLKYGKDMTKVVPVEFALTQGQFESHLGITGRSPSDNPFNVGEYDDRSADWVDRIENPSQGIAMYYDLMAEDYLSTKTPDQLLENGNFVNEAGSRYASNTNYESDLRNQINFIDGYINKNGGQDVNAPSSEDTTPTTTTPTTTTPSSPTAATSDYQAARPDLSRNSGGRAHNRWTQRGEDSSYTDDFNATIDDQVEAIFGAGYTRERVMQEIQEAQASGDIERANDLRRQLFTANIYNVVETLDVDSNNLYQKQGGATYCNIYAYDVVTAMGGYLPRVWWNATQEQEFIAAADRGEEYEERAVYSDTVHEMNANALTAWMPRIGQPYFGWQRAESMKAAQESANNGNLVIILAANKRASRSGHVNVILPETAQHESATNEDGTFRPLQSQAGGSNFKYQPHRTAWWEDSNHKDGAAWIATGQMDSPIMTPEQLGVQEAVSEESTGEQTDTTPSPGTGSRPENPNTTDETSPDSTNGSSWFSGIFDRVSDAISDAIDTIGEWISDLAPQKTGVVSSEALNVRAGHDASFDIVRTPLRQGESISIYEEKNGWYRIGHEQWVSGKHINILEANREEEGAATENGGPQTDTPTTEEPATPESSTERGIVTASSLNVRNGSNAQAPKVGQPLSRGTTVTIYEENNAWYRIGDGQWVSGRYVTKLGNNAGGAEGQPNWIDIAQGEIGVQEIAGSEHNSRVLEYHSTTGGHATDEVPWCASFVNWVMIQSGHGGNNSAWAQSWKNYGKDLGQPAYGAIAVIRWNSSSGHVGFVVGKNGNNVLLLGGNQSNSVNVTSFSTSKVIAYVVPASYEVPESAFTFGAANGEVEEGSFEGSR